MLRISRAPRRAPLVLVLVACHATSRGKPAAQRVANELKSNWNASSRLPYPCKTEDLRIRSAIGRSEFLWTFRVNTKRYLLPKFERRHRSDKCTQSIVFTKQQITNRNAVIISHGTVGSRPLRVVGFACTQKQSKIPRNPLV